MQIVEFRSAPGPAPSSFRADPQPCAPRPPKKNKNWMLPFIGPAVYLPLMVVMFSNHSFLYKSPPPTPNDQLVQAAQDGNLAQAQLALSHGANINAVCSCNRSALAWAADDGHPNIVGFLLARGASAKVIDDSGNSALILAARDGDDKAAALLLAHGAPVNTVNQKGYSALWYSVDNKHLALANLLLAHHANPNLVSKAGATMLSVAQKDNFSPFVQVLERHGARFISR